MPGVIVPAREFGFRRSGEVAHVGAPAERRSSASSTADHIHAPAGRRAAATSRRPPSWRGGGRTCAHTSSRPSPVVALQVSTGGIHVAPGGWSSRARPPAPAPPLRPRARCSPSALLTAITSASSRTPFLMPCSSSPVRASVSSEERVDHVGDRRSRTGRRRRSRRARRRSRRPRRRRSPRGSPAATPPSVPDVGDGRMNAPVVDGQARHARLVAEDAAAGAGRRRVDGEHGDPVAARRSAALPSASMNVDLPDAGHAGDADPVGAARVRQQRASAAPAASVAGGRGRVDSTSVIARPSVARSPRDGRRRS